MKTVTMCNYYYYYLLATCTTLYTLPSTFYFYPHTLLFYLVLVLQVVLRVPQRTTCATPCQLHHHRAFHSHAGRLGVSGGGSTPTRCSPVAATCSHLRSNNSWLSGDFWAYIEPAKECTAFPTNQFKPGVANHVSALT